LNAEGLAHLAPTLGEASLLDAFLRGCALLPIHLTAAAALGICSSPHQQSSSSEGKEQQALHLGLERSRTSTLWTLSAAGDHRCAKGLNGLLDPTPTHEQYRRTCLPALTSAPYLVPSGEWDYLDVDVLRPACSGAVCITCQHCRSRSASTASRFDLLDPTGSDSPRRASDQAVLSVGRSAGRRGWVVRPEPGFTSLHPFN
jgi:hypothetical protein